MSQVPWHSNVGVQRNACSCHYIKGIFVPQMTLIKVECLHLYEILFSSLFNAGFALRVLGQKSKQNKTKPSRKDATLPTKNMHPHP